VNELGRRAVNVAAIFVLLLVIVFAFMYWFGRGQLRGASRSSLTSDLKNLGVAESLYHAGHHTYTAALGDLRGFSPRNDVSVQRADSNGWEASAVDARTSQTCRFGAGATTVKCD
jgi:hypothetical protein